MPWKKSFDEEAALENAMRVFWRKGYEPASVADLLEGTQLNKGSLYNAFGGKQQLFVKALLKYDRDCRRALLARLESLDDPNRAIADFFDATVEETATDRDRKGCFLFNTALEISTHNEEVTAIVTNGVREIEAFFRRCIEVSRSRGKMAWTIDPAGTAKTLLALVISIRVLGRGVCTEAALRSIADEGKRLIQHSTAHTIQQNGSPHHD